MLSAELYRAIQYTPPGDKRNIRIFAVHRAWGLSFYFWFELCVRYMYFKWLWLQFDLISSTTVFRRTQRTWHRRCDDPGLARSSRRAYVLCGIHSVPLRHMHRRRERRIPQEGHLMGHARDSYIPLGASGIGPAAAAQPGQHSAGVALAGPHAETSA